jgi:hypothetical protein
VDPLSDLVDIMLFTKSYEAGDRPLPSGYYDPGPYDINWMMPLHEATLESDRVKLTPFIPSLYARGYADQVKTHFDLHLWFPFDLSTLDIILTQIESFVRRHPTCVLFAIIDKVRGDAFVGVIGLTNSSLMNLSIEMAWVVVFPEFRRSYVTNNAVGLVLNYCLELPSAPGRCRGLGFRHVQRTAHTENKPSLVAATDGSVLTCLDSPAVACSRPHSSNNLHISSPICPIFSPEGLGILISSGGSVAPS